MECAERDMEAYPLLSFQSLGVIYGRLSTAPLYVFESIDPEDIKSPNEIHELFSFVFWTLTIIPLLKHARVGLLPCNRGSYKILHHEEDSSSKGKLENKARRAIEKHKSCHYLLLFLALLGACMILSDVVLTPAISVLSATSGLGRSLATISVKFFSSDKTKDHVANVLKK
ncbi:Potassium transporter 2, partial [Sesamum angolense]